MKALVYEGPKILTVKEVPLPQEKSDEILIKVRACGICGSDVHGYQGVTGRRIEPMIMGHEFSGEVYKLGANVSNKFKVGDRVAIQPVNYCGECSFCLTDDTNLCLNKKFFGVLDVDGAMAEYIAVPEKLVVKIPDKMTFAEAALIEPFAVSYCGVKKADALLDKNVLIVGAGTIGLFALAVAKTMGPKKVVVSDLSDFRLGVAKDIGADEILKPKNEEFKQQIMQITDGNFFDAAIEAVGLNATVNQSLDAIKPKGDCVLIGNNVKTITVNMQNIVTQALNIYGSYIYTQNDFVDSVKYIDENYDEVNLKAFISKSITLDEAPAMFEELLNTTEKYIKVMIEF